MAVVVLVLFVLPAEYGIDPTGVGAATGLLRLNGTSAPEDPSGAAPDESTPPVLIQTYASSFPLKVSQVLIQEGYSPEGETLLIPFTLTEPNLTRVKATLEFHDGNTTPTGGETRPDTFEIELKAPHGDVSGGYLVRSEAATGGGLGSVAYTYRAAPFPRELDAASEAQARDAFARNDPPDTTLTGEWMARVSMVEAQDGDVQGLPLPGADTPANDAGNTWKLTISVETYSLSVAPKPGTQQRQDTVTLAIPAGGELEYKLLMSLGKRMDYTWSTDGPAIYVDFHGEKTGDASGAFTRHKNGDFATDSGTLIAPLDGRHGWFWRNTSGQAVTVTLETRGQYEVIGRV